MNETIGIKGGKNDRKRSLRIKQNTKKKLEEYEEERSLQELEKKVKKQQKLTLIKALPIAIAGQTVKTLRDTAIGRAEDKEEIGSKWKIKEYDGDVTTRSIYTEAGADRRDDIPKRKKIVVLEDGRKIIVTVPEVKPKRNIIEEILLPDSSISEDIKTPKEKIEPIIAVPKTKSKFSQDTDRDTPLDMDFNDVEYDNLTPDMKGKIEQLKSRKIVEEYEKQLKDIRYELRKLVYEYNVLESNSANVITSKEAEIILDKLSDVIDKIEVLKSKIKIDNLDKYDDNYIYTLIEDYLLEFKNGNVINEIKDSPLYILISKKLDELDGKKDSLNKEINNKKEKLQAKENKFEILKKRYYSIEKLNNELLDFQYNQDKLLKEVEEKVKNAVTIQEKVEVQFEAMNRQSRRLLRMLSFQMFLPGPRFARGMAASTAAYLYFLNQIIHPRTTTKRYKVITVKDYSKDIQNSLDSIDEAFRLLNKTSIQIDKTINQIEEEFEDYLGIIPECDELLANLRKIKSEMNEKEYEMQKIKEEQELVLQKNNNKVKTMGKYPM